MTMPYKLTLDCPKSAHHSKVIAYLLLSFKIKIALYACHLNGLSYDYINLCTLGAIQM